MPDIMEDIESECINQDSSKYLNSNNSHSLKLDTKLMNETFTKVSNDGVHEKVSMLI